jgi:hypothetical protein
VSFGQFYGQLDMARSQRACGMALLGSQPSQCLRIGVLSHLGDGQLNLPSTTFVAYAFISTLKQVIQVAAAIDI